MTEAIRTQSLTKTFDEATALNQLDWSVQEGSIHALLGPNGAGKTTTIKILMNMTLATSGEASVLGWDCRRDSIAIRNTTAFIAEDKLLYDSMYVHQFLKFYGSFFPNWSDEIADLLLNRWNPAATRKIKTLSRGERAKLLLIAALARKPRLLILDEPTDGLDPATIEEVFVALTQWVSAEGRTLVIATHRLDEVERIGDSITILNGGKSLLSSDLDTLRSEWKTIEVTGEIPLEEVKRWKEVADATRQAWSSRIITRSSPLLVLEKLKQFRPAGITVQDMNLREIYLTVLRPGGAHYDFLEKLV